MTSRSRAFGQLEVIAPLWLALLAMGCSGQSFDCTSGSCLGGTGSGGEAASSTAAGGDNGAGGSASTSSGNETGGTSTSTSTGGSNVGGVGSTGGVGTGGVMSACNPLCTGSKPVCNESAGACVECLSDGNCSGPKPACNLTSGTCVACTEDKHCSGATPACDTAASACVACTQDAHCGGATALCDTLKRQCVQCLDNGDCPTAAASLCSAGTCSPCATNTDCSHVAGKTVCKADGESDAGAGAGTCVECTGTDYQACSTGDAGTGHVCDTLKSVCSDKREQSADLCQPCVSDAQCKAGELCVEQKVNGKSLGYFCFWKQGDTANKAPADCTLTGRPYFSAVPAISIDEQPATICTLRASTCTALNQYSQASCASATSTPDDNLCGTLPRVDSKCVAVGATQYRCTVACLSDDDCPRGGVNPITCNTSGAYRYCSM